MSLVDLWDRENRARTVLLSDHEHAPWVLVRIRVRDRVLARLHSLSLDAQLAAGEPTASSRLRAVRAALLLRPATRRRLALGWQDVLSLRRSLVPVQVSQVQAAADEIGQLIAALRADEPVDPCGVARVALLLTDGTGPLYNPTDPGNVRDEIRRALQQLRPTWAANS